MVRGDGVTSGRQEERVYCGVDKKLGRYKLPLLYRVLKTATWISPACRDCIMFEHDEEVA